MTTTYNLDINDVIDTKIKEFRNLIKEENSYLRNSNEMGQVRWDEIRTWEDKIEALVELKQQVSNLLSQ